MPFGRLFDELELSDEFCVSHRQSFIFARAEFFLNASLTELAIPAVGFMSKKNRFATSKNIPRPGLTAALTRAVTSSMLWRATSCRSGHFNSSSRVFAEKPSRAMLRSLVPSLTRVPRPTWWLVITRPSGEMKEPEPPGNRTEDF